jgi:hypothetical protein
MEVKIAMKTDWEEAIHYCTRDILYGAALYCTVLGKLFICFFVCEHGRYPPPALFKFSCAHDTSTPPLSALRQLQPSEPFLPVWKSFLSVFLSIFQPPSTDVSQASKADSVVTFAFSSCAFVMSDSSAASMEPLHKLTFQISQLWQKHRG